MRCDAIMNADPVKARDSETLAHATELLLAHNLPGLPVVDAEGRYVGMFGADELAALIVPRVALAGNMTSNVRFIGDDMSHLVERYRALKSQLLHEVADRNAVALSPTTPAIEAFRMFCRNRTPLAVVDPANRKLVGVVSYADVIKAIAEVA